MLPSLVNQWFTGRQCMVPSRRQMQPRWVVAVDSTVKHTVLMRVRQTNSAAG